MAATLVIEAFSKAARFPLPWGAARALADFERFLTDRAIPMGLIAEGDRDHVMERHVLDCLRAAALFGPRDRLAYDLGSGAGLPGIVLAVALPGCRFALVETKARAAGFLELAVDRLGLENVDVVTQRLEDVTGAADLATARAFAPLGRSWEAACRTLRPGGRLIYFAGAAFSLESARAVTDPEPPADVRLEAVIEKASPLVIMTREGERSEGG